MTSDQVKPYYRVILREVREVAYEVRANHGAEAVDTALRQGEQCSVLSSELIEREVLAVDEEAE